MHPGKTLDFRLEKSRNLACDKREERMKVLGHKGSMWDRET